MGDPELTYFDVPRLRTSTPTTTSSRASPTHSTPSRHVVLRADQPAELVAADLRGRPENVDGVPPPLLRPAVRTAAAVQLLRVEPDSRAHAAQHIKTDTRSSPSRRSRSISNRRCVSSPAGGVILFSADQLHSTVPNTSGRPGSASTSGR